MKWYLVPVLLSGLLGLTLPTQAAEQLCNAVTVDRPHTPYGFAEINNCPLLNGRFANADWQVEIGAWEPAAYRYQGTNLRNQHSIEVIDFDVAGTTARPQYTFKNGQTQYVVTFRTAHPNVIRLEVFQGHRRVLNELLYR